MNRTTSNELKLQSLDRQEPRTRLIKIVTHIIVLTIVFVVPDVFISWGRGVPIVVYVQTLIYVGIFYLNYSLLIDRILFRHRTGWFVAINLSILVIYFFFMLMFHDSIYPPHHGKMPPIDQPMNELMRQGVPMKVKGFMMRDSLMLVLSMCLSITLKLSEKWLGWIVKERQIEAEKKETELKHLKNQLNPHFLFNTLNNIYALIGISTEKAQIAVHELSQLLRYVLYDNEQREVPLERDLLFMKNYIALMRLRLTSLVTLTVKINENDGCGLKIAPLMFVSLVENAFKHGVSASEPSEIFIAIGVEDSTVHCHVENTCINRSPESDKSGGGIGIANLQRQLSIIYPGRHRFGTECLDGKYIADLVIDLKND